MKLFPQVKVALAAGVLIVVALVSLKSTHPNATPNQFAPVIQNDTYAEYVFTRSEEDLRPSQRLLEDLQTQHDLLSHGMAAFEKPILASQTVSSKDQSQGVVERYAWEDVTYELRRDRDDRSSTDYWITEDAVRLFTRPMDYGADGPILDQQMLNDGPAFTFKPWCGTATDTSLCSTDVWYDGELLSKKFGVVNPRAPFMYNGKLGFIADDADGQRIYFNGAFVTPAFTEIFAYNCCATGYVVPTVYANGVFLFQAQRGQENVFVETRLE